MTVIATRRLVLRALVPADAERIAELAGDWDIASMTARMPYPYTVDAARRWMAEIDPGEIVLAITEQGTLVGVTGFTMASCGRRAEIGYWIGKPYWNRGYATEAVAALIARCFRTKGIEEILCSHFADNPASARVIEKLGFTPRGQSRRWCEARRRDVPAIDHGLARPRSLWRRLMSSRLAASGRAA
ncbi:MAG: GNAT family N-acetyltransferase [Hyphomicrobiaceae bacterium]|nr:GNAT family N-acetyltransferase [Hyphomicrobiaceae bacterium]